MNLEVDIDPYDLLDIDPYDLLDPNTELDLSVKTRMRESLINGLRK